jgi:uncharacterized protein (DUF983 family)
MTAVTGALCGRHPELHAVEVCARCGTFLCAGCVDYFDQTIPHCEPCLAKVSQRPSGRARVCLALALTGLVGMALGLLVRGRAGLAVWAVAIPTGFTGLALSLQELRAIARGLAPSAGRSLTVLARLAGLVHTLLVLALLGGFLLFLFRTRGE